MRELKAYSPYANRYRDVLLYHNGDTDLILDDEDKVYLKEDVDALLAEKDKMLARHKYKRCLAMARWCRIHDEFTQSESESLGISQHAIFLEYRRKAMWWNKWRKRWLELAEKFKPNNSTAR